ncbi:hypothetical protein BKA61DRAFT_8058 [Leptodontidium sp. MPI-SDFR-AT-0119]|nr:hypothetical protein BKA61DRAFT_8058 [Leptodontidium sp. MPI-SDFR-AT-0119]
MVDLPSFRQPSGSPSDHIKSVCVDTSIHPLWEREALPRPSLVPSWPRASSIYFYSSPGLLVVVGLDWSTYSLAVSQSVSPSRCRLSLPLPPLSPSALLLYTRTRTWAASGTCTCIRSEELRVDSSSSSNRQTSQSVLLERQGSRYRLTHSTSPTVVDIDISSAQHISEALPAEIIHSIDFSDRIIHHPPRCTRGKKGTRSQLHQSNPVHRAHILASAFEFAFAIGPTDTSCAPRSQAEHSLAWYGRRTWASVLLPFPPAFELSQVPPTPTACRPTEPHIALHSTPTGQQSSGESPGRQQILLLGDIQLVEQRGGYMDTSRPG